MLGLRFMAVMPRSTSGPSSLIEGIGGLRCEPSFIPEPVDRAFRSAGYPPAWKRVQSSLFFSLYSNAPTNFDLWRIPKVLWRLANSENHHKADSARRTAGD